MTTPEMNRCKHCPYLIENTSFELICSKCDKKIHQIPDIECPLEQEW